MLPVHLRKLVDERLRKMALTLAQLKECPAQRLQMLSSTNRKNFSLTLNRWANFLALKLIGEL